VRTVGRDTMARSVLPDLRSKQRAASPRFVQGDGCNDNPAQPFPHLDQPHRSAALPATSPAALARLGRTAANALRSFRNLRRVARVAASVAALIATASFAHNLGQDATFLAYDKATLDQMSARAAAGQPLVKSGDVLASS